MKKALIILGHPSEESLSGQHIQIAREELEKQKYEVKLYKAYDFPLVGHIMKDGFPSSFEEISNDLMETDIVLITTPMWHYSISGGLKNLFDGLIQTKKHYRFQRVPILNTGIPIGYLKNIKKVLTIYTAGGPWFFYNLPFINPNLIKKQISGLFSLCAVPRWRHRYMGLFNATKINEKKAERWFKKVREFIKREI